MDKCIRGDHFMTAIMNLMLKAYTDNSKSVTFMMIAKELVYLGDLGMLPVIDTFLVT
jgi:hypothetical protein